MPSQPDPAGWVNGAQAAGSHRVTHAGLFDEETRPHHERLLAAAAVGPADRVLDIGCGTGQSTRVAARAATRGSVLGVDLSGETLALARRLAAEEGLANASFERADAQVHRFGDARFDLVISQFGAMFFADPAAAFANLARALRPGGRLVLLVWQEESRNEWAVQIRDAVGPGLAGDQAPAGGAFSLGDPAAARTLLTGAGFTGTAFDDVDEPVCYGPDPAVALELVLGLKVVAARLAALDAGPADQARARLRALLAAHDTGHGIYFASRSWIITAHRPLVSGRDR